MNLSDPKERKALKGTTWKRGDDVRYIHEITPEGAVYWSLPGAEKPARPQWLPYFAPWIEKAQKVES